MSLETPSRREVLAGSAVAVATLLLPEGVSAAKDKKTFAILHTNDLHSNFIGMLPRLYPVYAQQ
jgi:5'-nucleotidase